jgi:hypothetical protein
MKDRKGFRCRVSGVRDRAPEFRSGNAEVGNRYSAYLKKN